MAEGLKLANKTADIYIPDNKSITQAAGRTTHMAIGAHQDDVELLGFHGIGCCFKAKDRWFTGVTVTDGKGSPRSGRYVDMSDKEMASVRRIEQRKASAIGEYSMQVQLDFSSQSVKAGCGDLLKDLELLLLQHSPQTLYLHSIFDSHPTHIAVATAAIAAVKKLPLNRRPTKVVGVEIWSSLDWLPDNAKVILHADDDKQHLLAALLGVYDSQIGGGKRYDLAQRGRMLANATFSCANQVDSYQGCQYAVNLMPLVIDTAPSVEEYISYLLLRYQQDVVERYKINGY